MDFGTLLSGLMAERGLGVRALARRVPCDPALISRLAAGRQQPSAQIARRVDDILDSHGELAGLAMMAPVSPPVLDDETSAVEITRRTSASDIGLPTVERLEQVADVLATSYASTPPAELLSRASAYLGYVTSLLDRRMTLAEHRRLLVTAGWLSLLAATSLADLGRHGAAAAHLSTAARIAKETGNDALTAWCLETRAWEALINRDYRQAAALAAGAREAAPAGGSALIQATAQEGRAWARLGAARETYDALARVEALVSPLSVPEHPEHHYVYDPAKAESYVATTLAWIGDPAAQGLARSVLSRIESGAGGSRRPRRATAARLDLALALAGAGRADESAAVAEEAVTSGWMVPSHYWRAEEVIKMITARDPAGALRLREALTDSRQALEAADATRRPDET